MEIVAYIETTHEFTQPYYAFRTIGLWQTVWRAVCEMAYNRSAQQYSTIVVEPEADKFEELQFYERNSTRIRNHHLLCFQEIWSKYDRFEPFVNSQLTELVVPRVLFECPGVRHFFEFSFPECKVVFWGE
jgi:hypothetical protein